MNSELQTTVAMQPLATRAEIADLLRVSRTYLDHAAGRGDGPPFYKIGKAVRYDYEKVRAWLDANVDLTSPEFLARCAASAADRAARRARQASAAPPSAA